MTDRRVPDDFPREPNLGSVTGSNQSFSFAKSTDVIKAVSLTSNCGHAMTRVRALLVSYPRMLREKLLARVCRKTWR